MPYSARSSRWNDVEGSKGQWICGYVPMRNWLWIWFCRSKHSPWEARAASNFFMWTLVWMWGAISFGLHPLTQGESQKGVFAPSVYWCTRSTNAPRLMWWILKLCILSPQAYNHRASKQTHPIGALALEEGDESGRKDVPRRNTPGLSWFASSMIPIVSGVQIPPRTQPSKG